MRSKIEIKRTHNMRADEITSRVMTLGSEMAATFHLEFPHEEIEPCEGYQAAMGFRSVSGLTKGMKGTLHLAQSKILMVLELPFALRPMADTIEQEINKYLDENFGQ